MVDDDEYTIIYRSSKAITPDLPTVEPDNSLSMGDEHLNTISETKSDEVIKSSVKNLVPIPCEPKGISDDICDGPFCDNGHFDVEFRLINSLLSRDILITSPKIDFLPKEFAGELDLIDPILPRIDEDDFDEEEGAINIDILQIEDEILREKLLNVNLLIDKIEALNHTHSIPFVLEYPSFSPIPVVDNDFLIEEVDTFLVLEDSIPPGIESDFDSEGDIVFLDNLLNDDPIPEYERFTFDIEPDAPVINNFDELNEDECFDPGGGTDIKEMDKIKTKPDKNEHETKRIHKSREFATKWSTKNIDITNDIESNDSDYEDISSNGNVVPIEALDDFIQHVVEEKEVDKTPPKDPKADDSKPLGFEKNQVKVNHFVTHKDMAADEVVSDNSKPPGFENFINENKACSRSSSTSREVNRSSYLSNYSKKDLKGFSFINEMNRMIKVGEARGYDVKGCKKSLWRLINGIGDLNEVRIESERSGSAFSCEDATIFNSFIHDTGFIDLPMGGRHFTWVNKVESKMSKLDHFLISVDVLHSNIDLKIDDDHATGVDRTTRINRMQELEDLEKLESMDLD
ncbi:RNA-directed DNA polymerase, eukaryota, reverse transcriptase zinc-binding domain protein [Tanacetum coccineum]